MLGLVIDCSEVIGFYRLEQVRVGRLDQVGIARLEIEEVGRL